MTQSVVDSWRSRGGRRPWHSPLRAGRAMFDHARRRRSCSCAPSGSRPSGRAWTGGLPDQPANPHEQLPWEVFTSPLRRWSWPALRLWDGGAALSYGPAALGPGADLHVPPRARGLPFRPDGGRRRSVHPLPDITAVLRSPGEGFARAWTGGPGTGQPACGAARGAAFSQLRTVSWRFTMLRYPDARLTMPPAVAVAVEGSPACGNRRLPVQGSEGARSMKECGLAYRSSGALPGAGPAPASVLAAGDVPTIRGLRPSRCLANRWVSPSAAGPFTPTRDGFIRYSSLLSVTSCKRQVIDMARIHLESSG
jgi:hypothetical protein